MHAAGMNPRLLPQLARARSGTDTVKYPHSRCGRRGASTVNTQDSNRQGVPIVCPTCSDVLAAENGRERVQAGDPIFAFCSSCERSVEVAAPEGIESFTDDGADAVDDDRVTEFPDARTHQR